MKIIRQSLKRENTIYFFVLIALFFCVNSVFSQKSLTFFQPQEKRNTFLPIWEKGKTSTYQIVWNRIVTLDGDKVNEQKLALFLGCDVKEIGENQIDVSFIFPISHLLSRTFGDTLVLEKMATTPVEIVLRIHQNGTLLSVLNYENVAKTLLKELDVIQLREQQRGNEVTFFNRLEKIKFDLREGNATLMSSTFVDLVLFFEAYTFPIAPEKTLLPFQRTDYEYVAPSIPCVTEQRTTGSKTLYSVRLDKAQDAKKRDMDFRYSVYFDAQNLPKSVGWFHRNHDGYQNIIETWTLLKMEDK